LQFHMRDKGGGDLRDKGFDKVSDKVEDKVGRGWRIGLALGLITLALYLPAARHEFIGYDDQQYVMENPHVQAGITRQSVGWAFGRHAANWHPLAWISHELDCQIYGLQPAGHHLTNALLHAASTVLLFVVLRRMTGATWRSAAVAALFGWHPAHVESVAWVAERKDVLSAFFWMLTIWAYVHFVQLGGSSGLKSEGRNPKSEGSPKSEIRKGASWYALALVFFALGLMSKPMVVTLPFVLLLLDYWPLKRSVECRVSSVEGGGGGGGGGDSDKGRGARAEWGGLRVLGWLVMEKAPFFALSAAGCGLTLWAQTDAIVSTKGLPVFQRVGHALVAYAHYLGATFVPVRLAVYYPYETVIRTSEVLLAGVVLAVISAVAVRFARRRPWLVVGWLWFLGTLVPVIGLVQVGEQAWADRYMYLPLVGLFLALVWEVGELRSRGRQSAHFAFPESQRGLTSAATLIGAGTIVGVAMLVLSLVQLGYWRDTRTLFEHAVKVTRNNYMATTLLGSLLAKEGKFDEAAKYYRTALSCKPGYPEAHFFLGHALDQQGKLEEAIAEYKQALWFKPSQEQTHIFLGVALAKQKKYDEAAGHYLAALKLNPESAVTHNNFAKLLHTQGRLNEAVEHYAAALKLDPGLAQAHNNLGILLLQTGKAAEGAVQLREALRLNPGDAESQFNLALALNRQEQWREAADLFAKTVTAGTRDANAHYQFGLALARLGRTKEAMSQYASALLINADFPEALEGLSWILATAADAGLRNGMEAVRMAERACELTGRKDAQMLKALAAAYAETGRFPEALATAQSAEVLAGGLGALAQECQLMRESFKAGKPWTDRAGLNNKGTK
jgi:tetratricopeptide (TPR) repeat protein